MHKRSDVSAAGRALHVLDGDAAAAARVRECHDSTFAADVGQWRHDLATLAGSVTAVDPPDDLLERIEADIDRLETVPANTVTLRREQGEWSLLSEGVECKVLWHREQAGRQTVLIRMAPGANYDTHHHDDVEECYVISGDLSFGLHELLAGDFHVGLPGGDHPPAKTRDGCLLLVSAAA